MITALVIVGVLVVVAGSVLVATMRNWIVWLGFGMVCAGCLELVVLAVWQKSLT